jgi:DNA-binding MarR family transcriptional regulator
VLIANLVYHGWIIRVEREFDFGPELYKTTPEGDAALAADKALEDSK